MLYISSRGLDGETFPSSDDLPRWYSIPLIHDHTTYAPAHHTLFAFLFSHNPWLSVLRSPEDLPTLSAAFLMCSLAMCRLLDHISSDVSL